MKVSIAKALKLKNRLGARIRKIQGKIQKFNSMQVGKRCPVEVAKEMEDLETLYGIMVELKKAIYVSNSKICEKLILMSELKGKITFLQGISTTEGEVNDRYGEGTTVYAAVFKYEDLEERIENAETELKRLQDDLDVHNAKTTIEIPDAVRDFE